MQLDLEKLRAIFEDRRNWVAVASVVKVSIADDRSVVRCQVAILPEQREIVARMSWNYVGPEAGIYATPAPGDLVLVAFADGSDDQPYVIGRLSSREDRIPLNAVSGDVVIKALEGRQAWLTSSTRINLSAGDDQPTENLVLGQQLKALLAEILTKLGELSLALSTHTHAGNLGFPTSPPIQAADFVEKKVAFEELKASPVEDESILSNVAFTEKGG